MNSIASIQTPRYALPATNASAPGLKVQLGKLKKEHAACVNCESAKTEVGQRNIQRLDVQIQQLESRLSVQAKPASAPAATSTSGTTVGTVTDTYA
jgi:hypothetical protein